MLTTTVLNYATTIPCKTERTRFLMELGKKYPRTTLGCPMAVDTMNDILKSI